MPLPGAIPRPQAIAFGAAFCAALSLAPLLLAQRQQSRPAPGQPAAPQKIQQEAQTPFQPGERLSYQVLFSKFSVRAGTLEFAAAERRDFFGRLAWHFRATAHSVDTVRALYALDDQFDSYADAARLVTLQYEIYLREAGTKEDHAWRMDTGGDPIPAGVPAARVLPGTRDPLSFLYLLRATDWQKTSELRSPVFDGRHLYDVQAQLVQPKAPAAVPAGRFNAAQIRVRVFQQGKELSATSFSVWLADDSAHTPVLIEASLPIGSARVELTAGK